MINKVLFSTLFLCRLIFAQEFEVKENSGLNKLERINSIETFLVKMESSISALKKELSSIEKSEKIPKALEELTNSQKKIREDLEKIKSGELSKLKRDLEFVDQEKVEKLIDKFLKYQEDTEKRIKFLEESLKEIYGRLNTVSSPKASQ